MKKIKSGGSRIKSAGRSLIWVTLDENEKHKVRTAAASVGMPMSQFLIKAGLAAAEKELKRAK